MAKAKKFPTNYMWNITPSTKNTTWEYAGDGNSGYYRIYSELTEKELKTWSNAYYNIPTRVNDDLVVTTVFINSKKHTTKSVKTTIKDFFTTININSEMEIGTYLEKANFKYYYNFNTIGRNGLFGDPQDTTAKDYIIASSAKKATLTLTKGGEDVVVDFKGNDEYDFASQYDNSEMDTVLDMAGNDSYTTENSNFVFIIDTKGNDKYEAKDNGGFIVSDFQGKDEYTLSTNKPYHIVEDKGNDKYDIKYSKPADGYTYRPDISDHAGNDQYSMQYSWGVDIYDYYGNDKYTLKNIDIKESDNYSKNSFTVREYSGNDKYELTNVKNSTDAEEVPYSEIIDYAGKDKYTISGSTYISIEDEKGADNYTIANSDCIRVTDDVGNDKYTITDCYGTTIHDKSGNDKYNYFVTEGLEGWADATLKDELGKDVYNIKGLENVRKSSVDIIDYSTSKDSKDKYNISNVPVAYITDYGGNDIYNLKQSTMTVYDYSESNDTYKIDKLQHTIDGYGYKEENYIWDEGGKDSLTISSLNKDNIVYMMDYWSGTRASRYRDTSPSLIIYDKVNEGFVKIYDFYKDEDNDGVYEGYGDGRIETIKAGKKALKDIPEYSHFNEIAEQVGAWLEANKTEGYELSVATALSSDRDVSGLIQIFQGG